LLEQPAPVGRGLGGAGAGQAQLVRDESELVRLQQRGGLVEPRLRGRDRRGQLANARGEVTGEGPQEGQRRVRVPERRLGDLQRGREQRDRALEGLLFAGERPRDGVEVADQALELRLVAGQCVEDPGLSGDQAGEIVLRGSQERFVDDRRVLCGRLPVEEGLVNRLGRGQPLDLRVLCRVVGRRRLVVQGLAVASSSFCRFARSGAWSEVRI
jgi:hypothetical protein